MLPLLGHAFPGRQTCYSLVGKCSSWTRDDSMVRMHALLREAQSNLVILRGDEQDALDALKVSPDDRSPDDLSTIMDYVKRCVRGMDKFARKGSRISMRALVHAMVVITLPAQSTVFEQGDAGDACYIVFSGEVGMTHVRQDAAPEHDPSENKPSLPSRRPALADPAAKRRSQHMFVTASAALKLRKSLMHLKEGQAAHSRMAEVNVVAREKMTEASCLCVAKSGDFFGELALLHRTPRSLSAVTLTQTTLVKIACEEYAVALHTSLPPIRSPPSVPQFACQPSLPQCKPPSHAGRM
jgi:CRP-like cAMP-binding protein